MRNLLIAMALLVCVPLTSTTAQRVLQLEKYGSAKVKKYFIGDELHFRLKGEKNYWYRDVIEDILADDGIIIFSKRAVKVDEIDAIRSYRVARIVQPIARNLLIFGTTWGLYAAAIAWPLGWSVGLLDIVVVTTSWATGLLARRIFRYRTFRLGKKRRLRLLSLDWHGAP
ncbi:MAG: hypothetical protein AAFV95_12935 [Bacteroidota bacterium]